jgi:hypothetical protein
MDRLAREPSPSEPPPLEPATPEASREAYPAITGEQPDSEAERTLGHAGEVVRTARRPHLPHLRHGKRADPVRPPGARRGHPSRRALS